MKNFSFRGIDVNIIRNNYVFKIDGIIFYASFEETLNIINYHNGI